MNTEQFCERLCSTYRLPCNKGTDYLHINVNLDPTPFVLSQPTSRATYYRGSKKGHRVDVSVTNCFFEWHQAFPTSVICEWYPLVITHIEDLGKHLYKATYIKQGRGYQLNLASTYVFYDGYRIASDDDLEKLKVRTAPIVGIPFTYFFDILVETLVKEFGDYLINLRTARDAGFCEKGIGEFIDTYNLDYRKPITLRELAPLLVEYDFNDWYRVRILAKTAWRYAKMCK